MYRKSTGERAMQGCYSADLHSSRGAPIFLLDNFRSAYNVGSVFRTAEAISPCHVILTGCCARPGGRRLSHTARGTQNTVIWKYYASPLPAAEWVRATGRSLVAVEAVPEAEIVFDSGFSVGDAFVFGNEALGISEEVLGIADRKVYIPQTGLRNCMNVAGAVAVMAMEIQRRRLLAGMLPPPPGYSPEPDEGEGS
jgi:23S rRNA (guanosine2251-2'-O)-methyltransferase